MADFLLFILCEQGVSGRVHDDEGRRVAAERTIFTLGRCQADAQTSHDNGSEEIGALVFLLLITTVCLSSLSRMRQQKAYFDETRVTEQAFMTASASRSRAFLDIRTFHLPVLVFKALDKHELRFLLLCLRIR